MTWAYDASYQLANEQRSGANAYNTTFLYDGVGNRTVKNDSGAVTSYLYNAANELTLMTAPTGQPTTSLWDANGNLLSENVGGQLTSYSWDGENRLVGVAYPSGAPDTMSYSAEGLRQRKVTAAGVVQFVWDEQNVLLETDGSGVTQAHYTDYPGYWGGLASQRRSGASNFYGFDPQANSRMLVTAADAISDSYLYRAFGEEVLDTGSTVNFLRFVGRLGCFRDLVSRVYSRGRYVQPVLGRWISREPTGGVGGWYVYVDNRPVQYGDPDGLVGVLLAPTKPMPPGGTKPRPPGGTDPIPPIDTDPPPVWTICKFGVCTVCTIVALVLACQSPAGGPGDCAPPRTWHPKLGWCDPSTHDYLQNQVVQLCHSAPGCKGPPNSRGSKKYCDELRSRMAGLQACLDARNRIWQVCYANPPPGVTDPGSGGHGKQRENLEQGIRNCQRLLEQFCGVDF